MLYKGKKNQVVGRKTILGSFDGGYIRYQYCSIIRSNFFMVIPWINGKRTESGYLFRKDRKSQTNYSFINQYGGGIVVSLYMLVFQLIKFVIS